MKNIISKAILIKQSVSLGPLILLMYIGWEIEAGDAIIGSLSASRGVLDPVNR